MTGKTDINIEEIIAERVLSYTQNKTEVLLSVKLGKPRPDLKEGGDWECPYQVGEKINLAYGVDSFQALILAQKLISIELDYLKKKQNLILKWLNMDDLGFRFE